jgi:Zn-dependent protease with chaperone function
MDTKGVIMGDYKKWLLYSFENQDLETHYHLIKALETGEDFESIGVAVEEEQGSKRYTVSHASVNDDLVIDDEQRRTFIRYLIEYYFHTDDVDGMMVEKRENRNKEKNHQFAENGNHGAATDETYYRIRQHPKEIAYYNVKLIFSLLVYFGLGGFIFYTAFDSPSSAISIGVAIGGAVFAYWILMRIVKGLFVGIIQGSSIRVTKDQYPEIYAIIEDQARTLGVQKLPEIYITSGHFNAFVTRFARRDILMIYSEVVETSLKGNYDVLKYVTAHELCHIRQRHLSKRTWLFPSAFIPLLSLAYSRACEYTCDRVGFHFSPKGAIEGVLVMTVGKEIHSHFNVERHLDNAVQTSGFWTWASEKFLTHPHMYNRLLQIKRFSDE